MLKWYQIHLSFAPRERQTTSPGLGVPSWGAGLLGGWITFHGRPSFLPVARLPDPSLVAGLTCSHQRLWDSACRTCVWAGFSSFVSCHKQGRARPLSHMGPFMVSALLDTDQVQDWNLREGGCGGDGTSATLWPTTSTANVGQTVAVFTHAFEEPCMAIADSIGPAVLCGVR